VLLLLAMFGLLASGCANWSLPAIDPSGERIFLPATTTGVVGSPFGARGGPAFPAPAPLPACSSVAAGPVCPGEIPCPVAPVAVASVVPEQLVLTPSRIVAPVGSEVVLTAGLAASNGYSAGGKKMEWMLSNNSVGNIVQVDQDAARGLRTLLHKPPRKFANDYAIGLTSATARTLTRGTPERSDDVWLRKGHSWVSITSGSEGVSYVTALAPHVAGWPLRQQTASIYWVDAQWFLPPPANVDAGQSHTLVTTLRRQTDSTPIPDWIVRYEITGGAPAAFNQQGDQAVEVATDSQGRAAAQLFPQGAVSGATQVRVKIIRTGKHSSDPARLPIGEGATTITWSAPALTVRITGPTQAGIDATLDYRIEISNPGDLPTPSVVVTDILPAGVSFLESTPAAEEYGPQLKWNLGDLAPSETRVLQVRCRAEQEGDAEQHVHAESSAGLKADHQLTTRISTPRISVRMSGPEQREVGQQVRYEVEVTNQGRLPLEEILITSRFGAGLRHANSASPIERSMGDLAPGETKKFNVEFTVISPGDWRHDLQASTRDGHVAETSAVLHAVAAPPLASLSVTKAVNFRERKVGDMAEFVIEVINTGQTPLVNITIVDQYDAALQFHAATDGFVRGEGQLSWSLNRLEPGKTAYYKVNCVCQRESEAAVNRVTVSAADQSSGAKIEESAQATVHISRPNEPAPLPNDAATSPGAAGNRTAPAPIPARPKNGLIISLAEQADPIRVGEQTTFLVVIKNERNTADENVTLTITLPTAFQIDNVSGPVRARTPNGVEIPFQAVQTLRAGETLRAIKITVRAMRPGVFRLRAEVRSRLQPNGVVAEEETTVNAN